MAANPPPPAGPPQPQRSLEDRGDTDPKTGDLKDRKSWLSGILIQFHYTNWHHDPYPACVVLYSDRRYTHAVNASYLTGQQRRQFKAQIKFWYYVDPRLKYYYLKTYNRSVIHAYRTYFTYLLHPVSAWEIPELEGTIPEAYDLLRRVNGGAPTDWNRFRARIMKSARARDVSVIIRETQGLQRPNQQRAFQRPSARPLAVRVAEGIQRIDRGIDSGRIRPPPTRPSSQRIGG